MIAGLILVMVLAVCFGCAGYQNGDLPGQSDQKITAEDPDGNVTDHSRRTDKQEAAGKALNRRLSTLLAGKEDGFSVYIKPLDDPYTVTIHDMPVKAASMIKLFILAEAFRQDKLGMIRLDEKMPIAGTDKVGGSGILQNVPDGTRKTLRELAELMIVESDNTATNILIDVLTMEKINNFIDSMGLKNTSLQRKMMDFKSAGQGRENYTSAADCGRFLEKLYLGSCIGREQDVAMIKILLRQTDNDKIPAGLPAGTAVAHKTGELPDVVHDGGIVYSEKHNYILCIMTANITDQDTAVREIAGISQTVYQFFNP